MCNVLSRFQSNKDCGTFVIKWNNVCCLYLYLAYFIQTEMYFKRGVFYLLLCSFFVHFLHWYFWRLRRLRRFINTIMILTERYVMKIEYHYNYVYKHTVPIWHTRICLWYTVSAIVDLKFKEDSILKNPLWIQDFVRFNGMLTPIFIKSILIFC